MTCIPFGLCLPPVRSPPDSASDTFRTGKGKKRFQGKETAGFVPLGLRLKIGRPSKSALAGKD